MAFKFVGVYLLGLCVAQGQFDNWPGGFNSYGSRSSVRRGAVASGYEMELAIMVKKAAKLRKKYGDRGDPIVGWLTGIETNTAFLKNRWHEWYRRNGSYSPGNNMATADRYLLSLTRNNQLLKKAEQLKLHGEATNLLEAVAMDMEIKADNCRNSADGLGKVIQVRIRTRQNSAEVTGYEVWFVQKGLYDVPSAHDRFRQQSSPTDERDLWPGGYAVWTRQGETVSAPTTIRIGGKGETKLEIDLEVP